MTLENPLAEYEEALATLGLLLDNNKINLRQLLAIPRLYTLLTYDDASQRVLEIHFDMICHGMTEHSLVLLQEYLDARILRITPFKLSSPHWPRRAEGEGRPEGEAKGEGDWEAERATQETPAGQSSSVIAGCGGRRRHLRKQ